MFNQDDSNYRIILISTRAGGLGINLATASDVILLDQDWNPQIMLQAEARAHRIGQTKPVTVYKLCTQGTVEEQMLGRIQKKLYLSAKVTESMRDIRNSATKKKGPSGKIVDAEEDVPSLDTSQLMSLVRRGAQTLARPELDVNEMLSWDWQTMLEKCKDKPADFLVSEQTNAGFGSSKEEEEKKWLSQIEHVQSRVFAGKQHKTVKDSREIAQEWSREERRLGKNTTVMVDGFAISKQSMGCADWEAVPTMAGKDPRLAEPKREKKAAVVNQDVRNAPDLLQSLLTICSTVKSVGMVAMLCAALSAPVAIITPVLILRQRGDLKARCTSPVLNTSVLIASKRHLMLEV